MHLTRSGKVDNPENVCTKVAEYFAEATDIQSIVHDIPQIIKKRSITYDEQVDKICFVIDRDRKSFVSEQYAYVLNSCRENEFGFYLSNPCFEMWLLMHYDEVFDLDESMLLENPKVTYDKRYAEHALYTSLLPRYCPLFLISRFTSRSLASVDFKAFCFSEKSSPA